ncbi:MAG: polyprenyl synthetase family protein [Actinomycetales bacterium]|nr:polyprenyl synthetase family protein [Actinomycetales bacterium]
MPIHPLDDNDLRAQIQATLDEFVADRRQVMKSVSPDVLPLVDALETLLKGGKRLRPAFAYWGFRSAGGQNTESVIRAVSSLEFLQACALIHDDIMDDSDVRRGNPAAHKQFESMHQSLAWSGEAKQFGSGAAILIGDLALSWADELLGTSGLGTDEHRRAKKIYDLMRTELMAGQYLDLLEQVRGNTSVTSARNVIRYKSAKYTIERPLHMGAAIAGATAAHQELLSEYGLALGEAFQLRDDVLGVFGDKIITGKPAGDDLREGKQTMLIARTRELLDPADLSKFNHLFGRKDLSDEQITELQNLISESGAETEIEAQIESLTALALDSLQNELIESDAREALQLLAVMATQRNF